MKPAALFLSIVAVLGLLKSHDAQPVLPCASQCSEVARPAVSEGQPVETPLVATLLPGGGESESPSKAAPPDHFVEPNKLVDGQLSPRGEWQWSEAQWAWVPVKQPGPAWVQDGHSATIDHLVREHGYSRASLENLTQSQLDVLHSNSHNAARAAAPVRSSGCPGGVCPSPSRGGFRLFRR